MTSTMTSRGIPATSPRRIASIAAKRLQLFKRLLTSLAVWPAPAGPTWMTSSVTASSNVLDPIEDLVAGHPP